MKAAKVFGIAAVGLWLCAAMEGSLAHRLSIGGLRPDFLLIFTATYAVLLSRSGASALGCVAGFLQSAVLMTNLAHYAISRTVAGFLASWSRDLEYEPRPVVVGLIVIADSLIAQFLLVLMPPPREYVAPVLDTIGSALYNGVLAMPLFALLNKAVGTRLR